MLTKEISTIGLGSFFPTTNASDFEESEAMPSIKNFVLFYTGRHAIKHLLSLLDSRKKIRKIWLPEYYCQHVTFWLKTNFNTIDTYPIDPYFEKTTINFNKFATEDDVVILNNFWGIYEYQIPTETKRALYIEDHSHGWLSRSCTQSKADYCFASLRKTLPIPLGGILWQPKGTLDISLPSMAEEDFSEVWDKITNAMTLKKKNSSDAASSPEEYLKMIGETEAFLHKQYSVIPLQKKHQELIVKFLNKDYNKIKKINFDYIEEKIAPNSEFRVLKKEDHPTFGLELVFQDREYFKSLKQHLIRNNIYPSELWPENSLDKTYKYLLNVHIDFRYTKETMDYIAQKINSWNYKQ